MTPSNPLAKPTPAPSKFGLILLALVALPLVLLFIAACSEGEKLDN
jgi:hypothetical protein